MKKLKKELIKVLDKAKEMILAGNTTDEDKFIEDKIETCKEAIIYNDEKIILVSIISRILFSGNLSGNIISVMNEIASKLNEVILNYTKHHPVTCAGCSSCMPTNLFYSKRKLVVLCNRCRNKKQLRVKSDKSYTRKIEVVMADLEFKERAKWRM